MSKKLINIFIAVILLVIVAGTSILAYMVVNREQDGYITLKLSSNGEAEAQINNIVLSPGKKSQTVIKVYGQTDTSAEAGMGLMFIDKGNSTIKKFVDVQIFADGKEIYSDTMEDALDGIFIPFDAQLNKDKPCEIKIVYKMHDDAGDAAKNTTADFKIRVRAYSGKE